MATLDGGRIGIAAQAVGIAQAAYDVARALRRRAPSVRQQDRGLPGDPVQARRHGDRDRGGPRARLPRRLAQAGRAAAHARGRPGEAVRLVGRAAADGRGDPGARRLRLHEGVPGRALLPRCQDHGDLRGDERDPAHRDRPRDPRRAGRPAPGRPRRQPGRLPDASRRRRAGPSDADLHPRRGRGGDVARRRLQGLEARRRASPPSARPTSSTRCSASSSPATARRSCAARSAGSRTSSSTSVPTCACRSRSRAGCASSRRWSTGSRPCVTPSTRICRS